jgi:hypothetical protein
VAIEPGRLRTASDTAAIEAALRVVPGVARAAVVADDDGGPGVLRLSLEPGSDEVSVARAVNRILRLQFGVGLDPGRIEMVEESDPEPVPVPQLRIVDGSVDDVLDLGEQIDALLARLDPDPDPGPRFHADVLRSAVRHPAGAAVHDRTVVTAGVPTQREDRVQVTTAEAHDGEPEDGEPEDAHPSRLGIARLTLAADGLGVTATVTLSRGAKEYVGIVDGPASASAVHRVVAAATLKALADVLGPDHRVDVEAVSVTAMGDGQVAVVQVLWATAEGSERLTGASEVRDDTRQAVIRATLDAVNRRLAPHIDL